MFSIEKREIQEAKKIYINSNPQCHPTKHFLSILIKLLIYYGKERMRFSIITKKKTIQKERERKRKRANKWKKRKRKEVDEKKIIYPKIDIFNGYQLCNKQKFVVKRLVY